MKDLIKGLLIAMADLLLPRLCIVCGRKLNVREKHICLYCMADFPFTRFWKQKHNAMADAFNASIQKGLDAGRSFRKLTAQKKIRQVSIHVSHMRSQPHCSSSITAPNTGTSNIASNTKVTSRPDGISEESSEADSHRQNIFQMWTL